MDVKLPVFLIRGLREHRRPASMRDLKPFTKRRSRVNAMPQAPQPGATIDQSPR